MPTLRLAYAAAAVALFATPVAATKINSGAQAGVANASFCPILSAQLKLAQFDYRCAASAGARENIERVLAEPRQLGYAQLDAFIEESRELKAENALSIIRQDDVRQCLFAVTRNGEIASYEELVAHAAGLRFVLPPAASDSAATFRYLSSLSNGLSAAKSVTHADAVETVIREALSADDTVGVFVDFPDPGRFDQVRELGGHVVPVLDRAILRQESGGKKIYFAEEVQVAGAAWITPARKVVTACTPLVVFTGVPDRIADAQSRKDHEDLIRTVSALDRRALIPQESLIQQLLKRTKELSAEGTEKVLEVSEQAREKTKPYADKVLETAREATDQAKQAAARAAEVAKPYVDKGKEAAQKAYDDALRLAKELVEKSKDGHAPKKD